MPPAPPRRSPSVRLGHVTVEVTDLVRSLAFYDRFLGRLGFHQFVRESEYAGYSNGELSVWVIREPRGRVRRHPITGEEEVVADHLAFLVGSADEVPKVQADLGRADLYPTFRAAEHPEFRPGYVSATWVDPDQVVWEVYFVPPAKPRHGRKRSARPARRRGSTRPRRKR